MARLFESTTIGTMRLANRFVASATNMGLAAQDGSATPALVESTARLAREQVGLVVTGFAYVTRGGQLVPGQMGCCDDSLLPGLKRIAAAVHEAGGKVALQIEHGGVFSSFGNPQLTGEDAIGPSSFQTEQGPLGRAMSIEEIHAMVAAFVAAARRGAEAGCDAVQVHACHGFLLSQFLSPFFNKRTDEYGGSLERRARIVLEIVSGVIEALGGRLPVLIKINSDDLVDGGFGNQEMVEVCRMLEAAGIDAIEISGGTVLGVALNNYAISFSPTGRAALYWRRGAELYKKSVKVPLILVGGVRACATAEELVESGLADYVSLCRPLIREPDLIGRWSRGDLRPSACVSDNLCMWTSRCAHVKN